MYDNVVPSQGGLTGKCLEQCDICGLSWTSSVLTKMWNSRASALTPARVDQHASVGLHNIMTSAACWYPDILQYVAAG
jgi:hypothetical protein